MVEVIIPSGHWRTLNAGVPAEREETEAELAGIRKQEGPADPFTMQLIRQAYEYLVSPAPRYPRLLSHDNLDEAADLAEIRKQEGPAAPVGQGDLKTWVPVRLLYGYMDKDIVCHKARNKRRSAARFRARELRRQSRASAPAPADVPALAAGSPVSPGQDESALLQYPPDYVWFCCGELANGEHHLICPRHPKNINLGHEKIMAAIHEIARN